MTAASTFKAKARQRAVDAFRRAKKERAARVRVNLKDVTVLLHAVDKLADTAEWKKARRAGLRAQADAQLSAKSPSGWATNGRRLARRSDGRGSGERRWRRSRPVTVSRWELRGR
jgi:hypothetical protein